MIDISVINSTAQPLSGGDADYDALLDLIGGSRFVLLGEATYGSQEFYKERALITQRLITEKGFSAVAIEGDWPDAYRVNRYVCNQSVDLSEVDALAGFEHFPTWMWRNTEVVKFINWLRQFNDTHLPGLPKVGFYGLDLYSLLKSIDKILKYLDGVDPQAAADARTRYAYFDQFERNSKLYGYAISMKGVSETCENEVVSQLLELYKQAGQYLKHDGSGATDALFYTQQKARLVKNAEEYYRNMLNHRVSSWSMRDKHMMEILQNLDIYISQKRNAPAKIVVWAHNSHLGDARATEMGQLGELNVGQLMRQAYGNEVFLLGFTTYHGSVSAAPDWGAQAQRKKVRSALHGSYEDYFHQVGINNFFLPIKKNYLLQETLSYEQSLERAIGVIYAPHTERQSHYFYANIVAQFDAIVHIDKTHALKLLEITSHYVASEAPETYLVGL